MNYTLFILILGALAGISLWIGRRESKRVRTDASYFLSGRTLGFFSLTLTFLATQLGGGAIVGGAEAAYEHGWSGIYYSLGISLGFTVLALGVGAVFRRMNVSTIPEVFKVAYRSKRLQQFASLFSVISLFFILVAIGVTAHKFFISVGFDSPLVFFGFWSVAILYTVMGGLSAVVKTDVIQVSFIMVVFLLTYLWAEFFAPELASVDPMTALKTSEAIPWTGWILMPFLFIIIGQDMGQRCFAAKSPKVVSLAAIMSAVLILLCSLLPVYLGIAAAELGIQNTGDGSILMQTVQALTNPSISSLFACAIFMAIVSTADSLICSISSNIALDFPFIQKLSGKKSQKVSQVITFGIGVSAMGLSYSEGNIIPIMVFAYELSVSVLFVPVIMAVILKEPSQRAAIASILAGIVGFLVFRAIEPPFSKELMTLGLTALSFGVTHLSTRRIPMEQVS